MKSNAIARSRTRRGAVGAVLVASGLSAFTAAHASPSIGGFQLLDGSGTLSSVSIDNVGRTFDLTKTITDDAPLTMRLTIVHDDGAGGPFAVHETVKNAGANAWSGYDMSIDTSQGGSGTVFSSFNSATMSGYTLDGAPTSGPGELSFTGSQLAGGSSSAMFSLSFKDPGKGNFYTVDLVQKPVVGGGEPVPLPMTSLLLAPALGGLAMLRKRRRPA